MNYLCKNGHRVAYPEQISNGCPKCKRNERKRANRGLAPSELFRLEKIRKAQR